jgi:multidrug efflux system membrane fusion protein
MKSKRSAGRSRVFPAALRWVVIFSVLLALVPGCKGKEQRQPQRGAPVVVGKAESMSIPVALRSIGRVEAYSTVSVKSQVEGQITKVFFREGQEVAKGAMLFRIDPRPFEAALREAEANLAKDMAQAENARVEAERYALMVQKEYVSTDQYDQVRANAEALSATVEADRAQVQRSRLDLEYTSIRSPIDGRLGSLLVHEGNVVKSNDTVLVTINQITPIYVTFSVPEQNLPSIKKYAAAGKLPVEVLIQGQEEPERGVLSFIDNAVDVSTGTILLKGTFRNSDRGLWPGQFVNVVLTLTTLPDMVVVPSGAVEQGQKGQYVYVVRPDMTVEDRTVKTGQMYGSYTVVLEGVSPGESVVTDGQLGLVPGAGVTVREPEKAAP